MSCSVEPATTVEPPLTVIDVTSCAATVMVTVALTFPEAAVTTADPAATPVTKPVLLTVAIPVAFDDHVIVAAIALPFWSRGDAVSCNVEAATTEVPPLMPIVVSVGGTAVTVIVLVAVTLPEAAVMTAVPTATPVTSPAEFTVAMFVAPEDHVTAAVNALPAWSLGEPVS